MRYEHSFRVNAPIAAVAQFHSSASSLTAITPPPFVMRVNSAPPVLGESDTMDFTMWAGPVPVRWVARIEDVSPEGFTDRQVKGPFTRWQHRHSFVALDERTTEVVDVVEAEVKKHPWWGPIGASMWAGLPALFAYRARKTRELLEQPQEALRAA
jgi:ligand-binding SRPBCC domain-containing protein